MKAKHFDLIGDIHGHRDKLTALLNRLGYVPHLDTYRHPEGRKVVFLGDYIDRGPKIRETLHLVRAMVNAGDALAIAGNHEFNAVCYATPDGNGGFLRENFGRKATAHAATLAAFKGREDEWAESLEWMKRLPFYLDLGELRAVHACWDAERIPVLAAGTLTDDAFLHACATKGTPEFDAIESVLKGPELDLPEGVIFTDKEGVERTRIRARWWNIAEGMTFGELVMPDPMVEVNHPLESHHVRALPNYPADAPPVFCGHFWLAPTRAKAPLAANIVCLDYSAAFGDNPLHAYRWDGEAMPTPENFVSSTL